MSSIFYVHTDIWKIISDIFLLDYNEVKSVMKSWLEKHHNLGKLIVTDTIKTPSDWLKYNKIR